MYVTNQPEARDDHTELSVGNALPGLLVQRLHKMERESNTHCTCTCTCMLRKGERIVYIKL